MQIPIAKTYLNKEEIQSVLEPLQSGWLVQGPKVREFEDSWCAFTGAKYSIAVTSCTTALYLSLDALGFGKGDEAIVPAFTWTSTANVIEHLGGKVLFADIDLETFNIDVKKIETLITKKTKAILPVHLFGLAADMLSINKLAQKYNLIVVEDAACGFGTKLHNQHVGTFGDTGCFSFHPRKAITTGEGGMITTNNKQLANRLRTLRDHGASISDLQRHLGPKPYLLSDHKEAGYNFRMTDIQAALGAAQMRRAEAIINERINLAEKYNKAFINLSWLRTPKSIKHFINGYQSYPCIFKPNDVIDALNKKDYITIKKINKERNEWMDYLLSKGISTRPATHAVHMLNFYKEKYKIKSESFAKSLAANDCSISLPLFNGMNQEEQNFVIKTVKDSFA